MASNLVSAAITGFFVSLSLILAIGAQNAFVLRQGLRREHVGAVVALCAISDALLIAAGVGGMGALLPKFPLLDRLMLWASIAFLVIYGGLRFRAAFRGGEALLPAKQAAASLASVLTTCAMLTWGNPHVYLDTVVLLGSISARHAPHEMAFGMGAALGSFVFFISLGFGARLLAPIFAKPNSWVVLEIIIGLTMWAIALSLFLGG